MCAIVYTQLYMYSFQSFQEGGIMGAICCNTSYNYTESVFKGFQIVKCSKRWQN